MIQGKSATCKCYCKSFVLIEYSTYSFSIYIYSIALYDTSGDGERRDVARTTHLGKPQPRYAPSMDSQPPPQPFYPQTLHKKKSTASVAGNKQQSDKRSNGLSFGEFY